MILIILMVLLGCFSGKYFTSKQMEGIEKFLIKISIPCAVFTNIINIKGETTFIEQNFIYSYFLSVICVILTTHMIFKFLKFPKEQISVLVFLCSYMSVTIYALPLVEILLNDIRSVTIVSMIQSTVLLPCFVFLVNNTSKKSILMRIFSTPMLIMTILALLYKFCDFPLPAEVIEVVTKISQTTSTLSLFMFGLIISTINLKLIKRHTLYCILIINILFPIISLILGKYFFELDEYWLISLLIIASSPPAITVYLSVKQSDSRKSASFIKNTLIISNVISCVSFILFSKILFIK